MKNNKFYKIIKYLFLFLTLILISYLFYNYITKYYKQNNSENYENQDDVNYATFEGYKYKLCDRCTYEIEENDIINVLNIHNVDEKWSANILLQKKDIFGYDPIIDYEQLKDDMITNGINVLDTKVIEKDSSLIVFECLEDEHRLLRIYMEAYDNNVYSIMLYTNDNDETALDSVYNLLSTAEVNE